MSNKLIRYELGAGLGVVAGADSGKVVIGELFPSSSSTDMYGVACDWPGNVYVSDTHTQCIYQITEGGRIRILAGSVGNVGYVNGKGTAARFNTPRGVACDKSGNIYVADTGNNRIRKIDKDGYVTTIQGGFKAPQDVAVGPNGEIYVADTGNHTIYKIEQHGRKLLLAGSSGVSGDVSGTVGGVKVKGATALFNTPMGITCDWSGNVYVSDTGNYKIKKISPDGWVTLYAGNGTPGIVNGVALDAEFTEPIFIKSNRSGELVLIDRVDVVNRLRKIDANGNVSTVAYIPGAEDMLLDGALGVAVSPANVMFVVVSEGGAEEESSASSETSDSSQSR